MKVKLTLAVVATAVALFGCGGDKSDADQPKFDTKVETRAPEPGAPSIEERAKTQGMDSKGDGG
jgi:ABC-type glycerol-3-phosphate transport system substrate-binding protein